MGKFIVGFILRRGVRTLRSDSKRNMKLPSEYFPKQLDVDRQIDVSPEMFQNKLKLKPEADPDHAKQLSVAILGSPNSGKSTLTNSLTGANVSVVSQRVNTTRASTRAITVEGDTQIVLLDTPGLITAEKRRKQKLEESLLTHPEISIQHAKHILVTVDASNPMSRHRLDHKVLQLLHRHAHKPSALVLNKTDLVGSKEDLLKIALRLTHGVVDGLPMLGERHDRLRGQSLSEEKQELLQKIVARETRDPTESDSPQLALSSSTVVKQPNQELLRKTIAAPMHTVLPSQLRTCFRGVVGWSHFKQVFMVSALNGDGMAQLKQYLLDSAPQSPWHFHSSVMTTQNPQEVAANVIRGRILEHLNEEAPYLVELKLSLWEVSEHNVFRIRFDIIANSIRNCVKIIGKNGDTIRRINTEASQELRNLFQRDVYLKLAVRTTGKYWQKKNEKEGNKYSAN